VRIAITAASGLIGSALTQSLLGSGDEVVRLVRRPPASAAEIRWNPAAERGGLGAGALSGLDAVVHLSGAPVAGRPWTPARKQVLRDSRISSTTAIVTAMLAAPNPPPVLLAASAIGWYGDTADRAMTEEGPNGTGFLAELVRDWEAATAPATAAGIRVVSLRSGIVLSRRGGMLPPLLMPFRLGLGARLGSGRQYFSWITLTDHVGAVRFVLERHDIAGPVNLTAPDPVTNAAFTRALSQAVHRPAILAVPAGVLRLALGDLSTELLGSSRVLPGRLEQAGFAFRQPSIGPALTAVLADR
jgi:uncharacterized protein